MKTVYKTDNKNSYGVPILLDISETNPDFWAFRWENESLKWGYNVDNCGTYKEVINRLKYLKKWAWDCKQNAIKHKYYVLIEGYRKEHKLYIELIKAMKGLNPHE